MQDIVKKVGSWLFLLGILVAVIVGFIYGADEAILADYTAEISTTLAVLGFIVGVLSFLAIGNISQDKVPTFLIAALMLVGIGAALNTDFFSEIEYVGPYFHYIAGMVAAFVTPAAGLLAIRAIWDAGKTEEIEKVIPKLENK